MRRKLTAWLGLLAAAVVGIVPGGPLGSATAGPTPVPTTPVPPCNPPGVVSECVIAVERNGVAVPLPTSGGDEFHFSAVRYTIDGTRHYSFRVERNDGAGLATGDTWTVELNTGTMVPWETFARGTHVFVSRNNTSSGHTVRFQMRPVRMAYGGCDSSGNCGGSTGVATTLNTGYLEGFVDDAQYVTDPDDRAAMRGFDLSSSADWISSPLQLDYDTRAIILDVGNAHFEPDGVTPFVGSAEFRLPFAMLQRLYLVDDPASLTPAAFQVTTGGASATTTVVVGSDDVRVDIDNIHFSKRRLRIHGDTTPGAPRNVRASRPEAHSGIIRFDPARSRGSKVRGYRAVCRRAGHEVRESSRESPIIVTGLRKNRGYDCVVRARSRAGFGRRAMVRMPR